MCYTAVPWFSLGIWGFILSFIEGCGNNGTLAGTLSPMWALCHATCHKVHVSAVEGSLVPISNTKEHGITQECGG